MSARYLVAVVLVVAALAPLPLHAHNNAVVHPEITDQALILLRQKDMIDSGMAPGNPPDPCPDPANPPSQCPDCAYEALWCNRGPLFSPNPPRTIPQAENDAAYHTAFGADAADIILGVVIEDGWDFPSQGTVVNHFYHARSAIGLLATFDSSRTRANTLFAYGLRLHDYTDTSQRRSYLYLGRFLHHVEDMSSPAHVHNDPHLYAPGNPFTTSVEKDDYEGRYVPFELWLNGQLRGKLASATVVKTVSTAADIWPNPVAAGSQPPSGSLAGFIYNRSHYAATLEFPLIFDPVDMDGSGELQEMFPDDPLTLNHHDGLNYTDGGFLGTAYWRIDRVGAYYYKVAFLPDDVTWWDEYASSGEDPPIPLPSGVQAYYYIENLNPDFNFAGAIVPPNHRRDYATPWQVPGNVVEPNRKCFGGANPNAPCFTLANCPGGEACSGQSMLERQGNMLLPEAVSYTAGAAQWWYRIANLPPYLKKVKAEQGTTKYEGEWRDPLTPETSTRFLFEATTIPTVETIQVVNTRDFIHVPADRKYINAKAGAGLTLTLEFNEPIKEISELKLVTSGGADVLDLKAVVAGQASNSEPVKEDRDRRWVYTILDSTLQAAAAALNGEFTLVVKAKDKNQHWQDIGGELDATPDTPAKRNVTGDFGSGAGFAPWHTEATGAQYVYDYTDGDRNHRLLFDTEAPMTTIQVTP